MYDMHGQSISTFYDIHGNSVSQIYDIHGNPLRHQRAITFEDDFNGSSLDESKWIYELGDCRPENDEIETYRKRNVTVENSCVVFTAKREAYNGKNWTSGSISTEGKFSQCYGRWEAKIKMPMITGAWAAFWMKGANQINYYDEDGVRTTGGTPWPQCGEIDITETIPGTAYTAQANLWKYSGGSFGVSRSGRIIPSDWNVYACEWTPDYMAFFVNDIEYERRYVFLTEQESELQAYHLPFFAILNLAVGGVGGTPPSDLNEMKMYVDWVRVYEPLA